MTSRLLFAAAAVLAAAVVMRAEQARPPVYSGVLDEHPAIQYAQRPTRDRVSMLARAIEHGDVALAFNAKNGYLDSVLEALQISPESQLLVFSKTGVQRDATNPRNPRAIFFDDSVAVGYIPGARALELAAHDPEQGVVFFVIEQTAAAQPQITRRTTCLSCHVAGQTMEVPGLIDRSMFTNDKGDVVPQLGRFAVTHRTPLLERWGGMFVTGDYALDIYGRIDHMGNTTVAIDPATGAVHRSNEVFVQWLDSETESRGYPSKLSDIAGLMLFDHQTHAINLLTRLNWEFRSGGDWLPIANELTDYLLFVDEAPPPGRLTPRPGFKSRFMAAGPKDRRGRSLRELDLNQRLLRYPCSYMIDSAAFEALPSIPKTAIYQRLWRVLSGRDKNKKYAHLSAEDRQAILEILRETKTDVPSEFKN